MDFLHSLSPKSLRGYKLLANQEKPEAEHTSADAAERRSTTAGWLRRRCLGRRVSIFPRSGSPQRETAMFMVTVLVALLMIALLVLTTPMLLRKEKSKN